MTLFDIVVVYLSLGAPSAVCHYFEEKGSSAVRKWIATTAVFFVWPPKTFQLLRRQLRKAPASTHFAHLSGLDSAVTEMKRDILKLIPEHVTGHIMFALRDVFEGYVYLTQAQSEIDGRTIAEVLKITDRTEPELGTICLNRRNAAKLERHQTVAGGSLSCALERVAEAGRFPLELIEKAAELAELLRDAPTESALRGLSAKQGIFIDPEGESWKSEPSHERMARSKMRVTSTTTPLRD